MKALIIGHGKQAAEYSKVLINNKIKIEGICGRNPKVYNFAKNLNINNIYLNISEALNNCQYDFVLVLITWTEIEKEIKKIIEFSKKVIFVEKPISLSKKKLKFFSQISKKKNKNVFILYNRRYFKTINFLKNKIKREKKIHFNLNISDQKKLLVTKYGKNMNKYMKYFMTSHWIDILIYIFGNFKYEIKSIDKKFTSLIIYNNKAYGVVNFFIDAKDRINGSFYFKNDTLKLDTLEYLYKVNKFKKSKKKYLYKKKLLINEYKTSPFKPGLNDLVKDIKKIFKRKKSKMPRIKDLNQLYSILEKIKL